MDKQQTYEEEEPSLRDDGKSPIGEEEEPPIKEKLKAVWTTAKFSPHYTITIAALGIVSASLEGIGLSFIVPIVRFAQMEGTDPSQAGRIISLFADLYNFIGIPFTLEFVIAGVAAVLAVRFTTSFLMSLLSTILGQDYAKELKTQAFEKTLDARIGYTDKLGSDKILNIIITEAGAASTVVTSITSLLKTVFMALVYLSIALYLAPQLTLIMLFILGALTYIFRFVIEPGYQLGDRIAKANRRVQRATQNGIQGLREIKLFGMRDEMYNEFFEGIDDLRNISIRSGRNSAALSNFYQLATAMTLFILIYIAIRFTSLSLAAMGVFLFATFRLSPRVRSLNNTIYGIEAALPHLIRTQKFLNEIDSNLERSENPEPAPESVERVSFENVSFSYNDNEKVLEDVSFEVKKNELIAFVGQSGAGKSTLISLLTRMYEPDSGEIKANGDRIDKMDIQGWREKIAVVRQNPYIFNDRLAFNVNIGNRDADLEDIKHACEISRVDEFVDDLPNGYYSLVGDDGVLLSGGQRQRVALARALLKKDADILVLDEATSELDTDLENQVHNAIETMDSDYAVIVIAHRLSTVVNADRIYTVENGRITEVGSHEELLSNQGKYAELYAMQSETP